MSDTPRTDRQAVMACDVDATDYVVPAEFARELEREWRRAISALSAAGDCGSPITQNTDARSIISGNGLKP